ncbi:MAG: hypothetical protein F2789_02690 [Actinobacteria bacterium]|nr:hypothetical protein [Actinomycetota bacterium]
MRRWFVLVLAVMAVLAPARAFATAPPNSVGGTDQAVTTTSIDTLFPATKRDTSECAGHSIELPDCGGAGRGTALMYVTFGLLFLGVAFIFWRVARSVKARDAALNASNP